jgi:hypothetical protein
LIINWENGKNHIEKLVLTLIVERVLEARKKFYNISSTHIYRDDQVDKTYKEALLL